MESGWWTRARLALGARRGRRGTISATLSTDVMTMAAVKVDEAVEEVVAEVRCVDVAVEEKEEVAVVAVEVVGEIRRGWCQWRGKQWRQGEEKRSWRLWWRL